MNMCNSNDARSRGGFGCRLAHLLAIFRHLSLKSTHPDIIFMESIYGYTYMHWDGLVMNKEGYLREAGSWHPQAGKVGAELTQDSDFFDAHDLVQMKYEMLRCVRVDGVSISEAAKAFGLSRVAFYRAQQQYDEQGMPGLLPRKRGPKQAHKLTPEVMAFVIEQRASNEGVSWQTLSERIAARFGTQLHPRSIDRAVKRPTKRGRKK